MWFLNRPIAKKYFTSLFKRSYELANISETDYKGTLRYLRHTTITNLRSTGLLTEAEFRLMTWHISDKSLKTYERPTGN